MVSGPTQSDPIAVGYDQDHTDGQWAREKWIVKPGLLTKLHGSCFTGCLLLFPTNGVSRSITPDGKPVINRQGSDKAPLMNTYVFHQSSVVAARESLIKIF